MRQYIDYKKGMGENVSDNNPDGRAIIIFNHLDAVLFQILHENFRELFGRLYIWLVKKDINGIVESIKQDINQDIMMDKRESTVTYKNGNKETITNEDNPIWWKTMFKPYLSSIHSIPQIKDACYKPVEANNILKKEISEIFEL